MAQESHEGSEPQPFMRSSEEVPGFSGFVQLGDDEEPVGRIWVRAAQDEGEDEGFVHPMQMVGEEMTEEEVEADLSATPEEEAAFQEELARINKAERLPLDE